MKKCLALGLALLMIFTFAPPAFAAINTWVEDTTQYSVMSYDSGMQYTCVNEYFIGETTGVLTLTLKDTDIDFMVEGREYYFGVYLLPDENSLFEDKFTINKLPNNSKEYFFIDGNAYWVENQSHNLVGISPIFTWGENEYNEQTGAWQVAPIASGKDSLSLAIAYYPETPLDDGQGHALDFCRAIVGEERIFANPFNPKGIPYVKYYSIGGADGQDIYFLHSSYLVLTPKIAQEILDTGGHTENGLFYPILQYFPEVEQFILDAQAKAPEIIAAPTGSTVLLNGKSIGFDAYNIEGNNYFKLRDLAYALNGTARQFSVDWNEKENAVILTSEAAYTALGGEMSGGRAGNKAALPTASKILLNGREAAFTAYNIEGNNYFKLRDIGEAFNFGVDWDSGNNAILINTNKGYGEADPIAPAAHPETKQAREEKARQAAKAWAEDFRIHEFNDYTKAAMIFAYLNDNVATQTDQSNEAYATNFGNEAYAALVMKIAACSGFCKAVTMLCDEAGLESKHINAGTWGHQWNTVLIDGEWLVLDSQGGIFGVTKHPLE